MANHGDSLGRDPDKAAIAKLLASAFLAHPPTARLYRLAMLVPAFPFLRPAMLHRRTRPSARCHTPDASRSDRNAYAWSRPGFLRRLPAPVAPDSGFPEFLHEPSRGPDSHAGRSCPLPIILTPTKRQGIFKWHPLKIRVAPVSNFTKSKHHHATRSNSLSHVRNNLTFSPAPKINQHVLAKNQIHVLHWCLFYFQHVQLGKTHSVAQRSNHLVLALIEPFKISFSYHCIDTLNTPSGINPTTRLAQCRQATISSGDTKKMLASLCRKYFTN